MLNRLSGALRKLIPTVVLIALAVLAGFTDVFSTGVRDVVGKMFQEFGQKVLPFGVNLLIAAIVINLAYLVYQPLTGGITRALKSSGASDRGKNMVLRTLQLVYWGGAVFIALTIVAPDVLSKVFLGGSLFLAALTLALQGAANDFISGVLLQFTSKFKLGDEIDVIGLNVKGKVKDITYVSTLIEAADGMVTVSNREVWARAVKVVKPEKPKSAIIIPPGVDLKKD